MKHARRSRNAGHRIPMSVTILNRRRVNTTLSLRAAEYNVRAEPLSSFPLKLKLSTSGSPPFSLTAKAEPEHSIGELNQSLRQALTKTRGEAIQSTRDYSSQPAP